MTTSSNREDLVRDLQNIVVAYQARPSSLLAEFEHFMQVNRLMPEHKTTRLAPYDFPEFD